MSAAPTGPSGVTGSQNQQGGRSGGRPGLDATGRTPRAWAPRAGRADANNEIPVGGAGVARRMMGRRPRSLRL